MRHWIFGVLPDIVETMHFQHFFAIGWGDGAVGFHLGFEFIIAFGEGIETGLGFRTFHHDGIGVLGITFDRHILVVGKEREGAAPAFQHDGIHLVVVTNRSIEHGIPVLDDR